MAKSPASPPLIPADLARGSSVIAVGDSTVAGDSSESSGSAGAMNWFVRTCLLSGGRFRYLRNAGVSGDTTQKVLDRLDADVIAYKPARCFVLVGTNDAGGSVTLATFAGNYALICNRLRGAGIEPIPCTITPRSSAIALLDTYNAWIRQYAAANGYHCLDFHSQLVDHATGGWVGGYTGDNLHPNSAGTKVMAQYAVNQLAARMPYEPLPLCQWKTDGSNLATDGTFSADGNSDGVADNWTSVGAGGTLTYSLVDGSGDGIIGQWQQVAVTVSALRYLQQTINSGFSVGDKLAFCGLMKTANVESGVLEYGPSVVFNGASGSRTKIQPFVKGSTAAPLDGGPQFFSMEGVIPAGTTSIDVRLTVSGSGSGTVQWGQITLLNLTALGLA